MYRYPIAAGGVCMPQAKNAESVLSRNGIGYRGKPSSAELASLAKGIGQVENLLGKPIPEKWKTKYNFVSTARGGKWNQSGAAINVRRPAGSKGGQNVGRLMHEFGHKVGNAGAYAQYKSFTGGRTCGITGYAMTKQNEQFAEVFSAYVTYPDLLQKKCPQAYKFFSQKLFPGSSRKIASCDAADRQTESDYGSNGIESATTETNEKAGGK